MPQIRRVGCLELSRIYRINGIEAAVSRSTGALSHRQFSPTLKRAKDAAMLYGALLFLIVAIVAGALGFGGIASTATGIARVLFVIFLIVFLVMTVANFVT